MDESARPFEVHITYRDVLLLDFELVWHDSRVSTCCHAFSWISSWSGMILAPARVAMHEAWPVVGNRLG